MYLDPEKIAYWFFRLNGCLTIENFVVHPESRQYGGSQRTDADILAVRFPYRAELIKSGEAMVDHPLFESNGKIDLIIAEVKTGECKLNGPWNDSNKENIDRILFSMGLFKQNQVPQVAQSLYSKNIFEDDQFRVRLFAIGNRENTEYSKPLVQLTWRAILSFTFDRFNKYYRNKVSHQQWDETGQLLFKAATQSDLEDFIQLMCSKAGISLN